MALAVEGGVFGLVDVGGDDAVEVAPADDEAQGDAALVDAFGVVGGPDDGVGDASGVVFRVRELILGTDLRHEIRSWGSWTPGTSRASLMEYMLGRNGSEKITHG